MTVAFVSNFLNHHQLPFCQELSKRCDAFWFVATDAIPEERRKLGYADMRGKDFVIEYQEDETQRIKAEEMITGSDIVIFGSCPDRLIALRAQTDKPSFIYTERLFKKGAWRRFIPRTRKKLNSHFLGFSNKNLFILCASAYASKDISYLNKNLNFFKWGYFPEFKTYDMDALLQKKAGNTMVRLLWVGRFLGWKHPDDAIETARKLNQAGYDFVMDIIGTGEMENELKDLIVKYALADRVNLLGSMKPEQVREYMEAADIYLFTSDFNEGWGVVLNEAMNSGCAVAANHGIGSVPYLLSHGKNGLIYQNGKTDDLYRKIKFLMDSPEKRRVLGKSAYETLQDSWNAPCAAERFLTLSKAVLNNSNLDLYEKGPCSRAEVLHNRWLKGDTYESLD